MTVVSLRAAGAKHDNTTAAEAVTAPASIATGDLDILIATVNQGDTLTITNNGGGAWTSFGSMPKRLGAVGEDLYAWWRIRQVGDGDPTIQATADHFCAFRMAAVNGTFDASNPILLQTTSTDPTSQTAFSWAPGLAIQAPDLKVVLVATNGRDNAAASCGFGGGGLTYTPGSGAVLNGLTVLAEYNTADGGGGGFGVAVADSTSSTGNETLGTFASTYAAASRKAELAFVIKPSTVAYAKTVSESPKVWESIDAPLDAPVTPVLDDFERVDENPLTQAGKWANVSNTRTDASGNAYNPTFNPAWADRSDVGTVADAEVWATYDGGLNQFPTGLILWLRATGTLPANASGYALVSGYMFNPSNPATSTGIHTVARYDAGVATVLKRWQLDAVAGDKIGLRAVGSTLNFIYKRASDSEWKQMGKVSDATYASGKIGATTTLVDPLRDFGGGLNPVAYALGLSESPVVSDARSKAIGKRASEAPTVTETISKGIGVRRAEAPTVADLARKGIGVRVLDAPSVTDALAKAVGARVLDAPTVADVVSKAIAARVADGASVADQISKGVGARLGDAATISEALTFIGALELALTGALYGRMPQGREYGIIEPGTDGGLADGYGSDVDDET